MAVINEYKFAGLNANTDNTEKNPFGTGYPLVSETYVIKSIIVSEDSGNADTITVTLTDTSDNVFSLFKTKSISANATTELLSAPLVAQESEVIKVTAATANRLHVVLSALEIKPREVTT